MPTGESPIAALASQRAVSNVLVQAPPRHDGAATACATLSLLADETEQGLVGVINDLTPDEWVAEVRESLGTLPARVGVVAVGERHRSAAATGSTGGPSATATLEERSGESVVAVRTVATPAQLTKLGVRITECLDEVTADPEVSATALCVRSLTPFLQSADTRSVFRFLSVLTGYVATRDVLAHYHLDPEAHDEQTVAQLTVLFDAVVTFDEADDPVVRTRFA